MKQLYALAVTVFLAIFFVVAVNAAPPVTSDQAKIPQGLKNAKKAMMGKLEHDKMVQEVQKKGQAKRKQAQKGK